MSATTIVDSPTYDVTRGEVRTYWAGLILSISKYMIPIVVILTIAMAVLWLLVPRYTQFLVIALVEALSIPCWALYPFLYRKRQVTLGFVLCMVSLLTVLGIHPPLLPTMIAPVGVGFGVLLILGIPLLGMPHAIWLVLASLVTFSVDILMVDVWQPAWFPPLDGTLAAMFTLATGAIVVIVAAVVVRITSRDQERQLRESQLARREIEQRAAVEQEQNRLLQQVNQEIEQRAATEQQQREYLQQLIAQAREVANTLNAATAEILAATNQQVSSVTEQDVAVSQTMTTVEQVRTTVRQTAERAQAVADSARQSVSVSQNGQAAITNTITGMRTIQERVEAIAQTILALSQKTQQIGEIIDTVNDLADQSKLLALNASIEAARAGEDGRGFAVVAMEVRQLAEQSRDATARIRAILNEIQQATNTAVMVTEEGSKGADTGMTLVQNAGDAIRELAGTIEEAAQAAMQIAASTNQQTNGMDQLVKAMLSIKQATTQTASSAEQTERSAQDLSRMAQDMERTIADYQG